MSKSIIQVDLKAVEPSMQDTGINKRFPNRDIHKENQIPANIKYGSDAA